MFVVTIQEVWYGDSATAKCVRIACLPLSCLYGLGWQLYQFGYKIGIKKPYKTSCKVICVGNFSSGGTGKTPTVVFVAKCLQELGIPFVIGCSGYGAPRSAGASIAPNGPLNASEWGDEPAEIRELLPDTPLIIGRRRVLAARLCEAEFANSILLMDDGFQHMPLYKDHSIILDPPTSNSWCFPAGPYREPRWSGKLRADLVIPSNEFSHNFSPLTFSTPDGQAVPDLTRIRVLTAIGRPDKFRTNLESTGTTIVEFISFPDHHQLDIDLAEKELDLPWVVTRKDWVKLRKHCDTSKVRVVIAERSAAIAPTDEFKKWLKIRLG